MPIYLFEAPRRGVELADPDSAVKWETLSPILSNAHRLGHMAVYLCSFGVYDIRPKYGGTRSTDYYLSVDEPGEQATVHLLPREARAIIAYWDRRVLQQMQTGEIQIPQDTRSMPIIVNHPSNLSQLLLQTVVLHNPALLIGAEKATPISESAGEPPTAPQAN